MFVIISSELRPFEDLQSIPLSPPGKRQSHPASNPASSAVLRRQVLHHNRLVPRMSALAHGAQAIQRRHSQRRGKVSVRSSAGRRPRPA